MDESAVQHGRGATPPDPQGATRPATFNVDSLRSQYRIVYGNSTPGPAGFHDAANPYLQTPPNPSGNKPPLSPNCHTHSAPGTGNAQHASTSPRVEYAPAIEAISADIARVLFPKLTKGLSTIMSSAVTKQLIQMDLQKLVIFAQVLLEANQLERANSEVRLVEVVEKGINDVTAQVVAAVEDSIRGAISEKFEHQSTAIGRLAEQHKALQEFVHRKLNMVEESVVKLETTNADLLAAIKTPKDDATAMTESPATRKSCEKQEEFSDKLDILIAKISHLEAKVDKAAEATTSVSRLEEKIDESNEAVTALSKKVHGYQEALDISLQPRFGSLETRIHGVVGQVQETADAIAQVDGQVQIVRHALKKNDTQTLLVRRLNQIQNDPRLGEIFNSVRRLGDDLGVLKSQHLLTSTETKESILNVINGWGRRIRADYSDVRGPFGILFSPLEESIRDLIRHSENNSPAARDDILKAIKESHTDHLALANTAIEALGKKSITAVIDAIESASKKLNGDSEDAREGAEQRLTCALVSATTEKLEESKSKLLSEVKSIAKTRTHELHLLQGSVDGANNLMQICQKTVDQLEEQYGWARDRHLNEFFADCHNTIEAQALRAQLARTDQEVKARNESALCALNQTRDAFNTLGSKQESLVQRLETAITTANAKSKSNDSELSDLVSGAVTHAITDSMPWANASLREIFADELAKHSLANTSQPTTAQRDHDNTPFFFGFRKNGLPVGKQYIAEAKECSTLLQLSTVVIDRLCGELAQDGVDVGKLRVLDVCFEESNRPDIVSMALTIPDVTQVDSNLYAAWYKRNVKEGVGQGVRVVVRVEDAA